MMVIDPDECIDCAVCIPECPVNAIYAEEDLPSGQLSFVEINQKLALTGTTITRRKSPLPNAEAWKDVPGKAILAQTGVSDIQMTEIDGKMDRLQHLVTAERLAPKEWSSAMNDSSSLIRLSVVARSDFTLERSRLDRALIDLSDDVRRVCIEKCGSDLTKADIKTLILDPSPAVRLALIKIKAEVLTKDQIEFALNDTEHAIRLAVIQLSSFTPNDQQILRLLEIGNLVEITTLLRKVSNKQMAWVLAHPSANIRAAAFGYMPYSLTKTQIKEGLLDNDRNVLRTLIDRNDIHLTPRQFIDIISSGDLEIIDIASRKADAECIEEALKITDEIASARVIDRSMKITEDQLNRCISDHRRQIALVALTKIGKKINNQQISSSLKSKYPDVRRLALSLYGVDRLSAKQFAACLKDLDETIRFLAISCQSMKSNDDQLEKALEDSALRVRSAAASRSDFLPTVDQFKKGLADKSKKVREIYSLRFALIKGKIIDKNKQKSVEPNRRLKNILKEIAAIETWTDKKHQLKDELLDLLQKLNYIQFSVDARQAWLSQIGEQTILDVPLNKRGHLQPMRGKKVHLVCTGHGRYSTISFAAKAV
jgi:hypothetical protein